MSAFDKRTKEQKQRLEEASRLLRVADEHIGAAIREVFQCAASAHNTTYDLSRDSGYGFPLVDPTKAQETSTLAQRLGGLQVSVRNASVTCGNAAVGKKE